MSDQNSANQWLTTSIGKVATINPAKPKYLGLTDSDIVGFVPMAAVDEVSGTVTRVEERPLGEVRSKSYRTFAPNDILFAKITPCMENGKSAMVPELPNGHGFGSTEFHVIRPDADVESRYLWRFVRQTTYRAEAEARMTGSVGQLRVPVGFLRETEITLPPLDEQRRILECLDELDAHRDAALAHLGRTREVLTSFRQAIVTAACSGRLTEDWREMYPNARALKPEALLTRRCAIEGKRVKEIRANPHASTNERPNQWSAVPLGLLLDDLKYGTSKLCDYRIAGTPVLRIPNVSGLSFSGMDLKFTVLTDTELSELALRSGDLLMIRSNGSVELVGKTMLMTNEACGMAFAGYLMRLRVDPVAADPGYLELALSSSNLRAQIEMPARSTSGVHNINTSEVRGLVVPLPSLDEQREIVRRVDRLSKGSEVIFGQVESVSNLLNRASEATLAKAFRGELLPAT